jgi:cytochrome P450 / NADPH-cytochrome P450 reductase
VAAFEETVITSGDKAYKIPVDAGVAILAAQLHRDTKVWGDDVSVDLLF